MKSYDYEAVAYNGAVYCTGCLPEGVKLSDEEVSPIFADSEWDYAPVCDKCGTVHDYVTVLRANVHDYFEDQFGHSPADTSLRDLPLDSSCGKDCGKAIDAGVALREHAREAVGGEFDRQIADITERIVTIYWRG
jgi:hypothetical protein